MSYTIEEVSKHNKYDDCWIIIDNCVYDVTKYVEKHPGGANNLLKSAGKDATNVMDTIKSHRRNKRKIRNLLKAMYIGRLRLDKKT